VSAEVEREFEPNMLESKYISEAMTLKETHLAQDTKEHNPMTGFFIWVTPFQ
jgi:hypothetical protein